MGTPPVVSTVTHFRYHTETIGGVELEKPVRKRLHAIIHARIQRLLETQLQGRSFQLLPALDMLCGPDRYLPDLTVGRKDAAYTNDILDDAAFLTIEIMSPGQTVGALFEKCEAYVQHGTSFCWVIWPKRHQAWIYTRSAITEVFETAEQSLVAGNEVLSLSLPVRELFASLPESNED